MLVTCPECAARLQLRRAPAAGLRVRCPKCSALFVPGEEDDERPPALPRRPAPALQRRRPEPEEEHEDDEEEEDEEYRPSPRPRRKRRQKRRRAGNPVLFWGLIAGGAALAILGVVLVVVLWPSSNNKYDAVLQDSINVLNEMADVLESVKNRESARSAAPRIEQLCDRLVEIAKRARDLPKPSESESRRLQKKWEPQLKKVAERMTKAGFQAGANAQGEPTFMSALQKMQRVGTEIQTFGN